MARAEKTIHYLYKTTCIITGRWYIGMHSTCNMDDGYMGSGKRLRYSIRKYGVDNHEKEILEFFETRELLIEAEIKAITAEMITDTNCMNLAEGGFGGHGARFLTKEQLIKGGCNAIKKIHHTQWVVNGDINRVKFKKYMDDRWLNDECKEKMLKSSRFNDKKHSDETKQKMSEIRKGTGIGDTNSQYGTCWITKDGLNKKIKKEEILLYLNEGWVKGRK
jgi:hypothetical protein